MSSKTAAEEAAKLLLGLTPAGAGGAGAAAKKKKPKKKKAPGAAGGPDVDDDNNNEEMEGGEEAASEAPKVAAAAAPAPAKKAEKPAKAAPENKMAKAALEHQARVQKAREEQLRLEQLAREAEQAEQRAAEEAKRLEEEEKEKRRLKRQAKKERDIAEGKPTSKAEREKARLLAERRAALLAGAGGLGVSAEAVKASAEKPAPAPKKKSNHTQPQRTPPAAAAPAVVAAPVKVEKDWDESDDEEAEASRLAKIQKAKAALEQAQAAAKEVEAVTVPAIPTGPSAKSTTKKESKKASKKPSKAVETKGASKEEEEEEEEDSEEEDSEEEESSEEEDSDASSVDSDEAREERIEAARERREARAKAIRETFVNAPNPKLRSPIVCVLGHVDAGKTKTLDMLRKTNVQEGEAGGITQQIGATFFPVENLVKVTDMLPESARVEFKIPGLQIIDTPGHEAFTNLRNRGSSLADIAVLVVDIKAGLQQQAFESLGLLRKRRTPFLVILNKIDNLYGWKTIREGGAFLEAMAAQNQNVKDEFERLAKRVVTQLMEQSFNAKLYYENDDPLGTVSLVPISARTGEGSPDLLMNIAKISQTQLTKRITWSSNFECSVLEVKKIEGLGTTVDVIVVNGTLRDDDELVFASPAGPVVTRVRALLTPQPMREMRVKNDYIVHKEIVGTMGVKLTANDLDHVVAGTRVMLVTKEDDLDELKDTVMADVHEMMGNIRTVERGVFVQASTLGSLEALMEHLRTCNPPIPVSGVGIGTVYKKDVTRAGAMLDRLAGSGAHNQDGPPPEDDREFATILAFDVKIDPVAGELAKEMGIKIFSADIIYTLSDEFTKHASLMREERKKKAAGLAVFPCVLSMIKAFNRADPMIVGVDVKRGKLLVGTPLCVPGKLVEDPANPGQKIPLEIGRVSSIELDRKDVPHATRGQQVCIKIEGVHGMAVGKQFDVENQMVSKISRASIDALKKNFKPEVDALHEEGWGLIQNVLKPLMGMSTTVAAKEKS